MKKLTVSLLFLFLLFVVALFLTQHLGFYLNTSKSIPVGVYKRVNKNKLEKGDIVVVCLKDSPLIQIVKERGYIDYGQCPDATGGYSPFIKYVTAIRGDSVVINNMGIAVNGNLVPNTAPLVEDGLGKKLPQIQEQSTLADNQIVINGITKESFDSRYFGIVDKDSVVDVVKPLWLKLEK